METFLKILISFLLVWMMVRAFSWIRAHPEQFDRKQLSRSITTMGLLALALIALIGIMVLLLRH